MKQFAFVIDCDRCIGCKGCQVACKLQNTIALGQGRNKVCTIGPSGTFPNLQTEPDKNGHDRYFFRLLRLY